MSTIITPQNVGRKNELLETLDSMRALVNQGQVAGIVSVMFQRDGRTVQIDDSANVGGQFIVGALDYLKLKILAALLGRESKPQAPKPHVVMREDKDASPIVS